MNKLKTIIKRLWFILFAGIAFITLFIISVNYNVSNLFGGMPSLQDLEKPESELSSELYSSDNILLGKYFRYNILKLSLKHYLKFKIQYFKFEQEILFSK